MSIVFVKTRHEYGSYRDFWSLVELSKFETIYIDEIDLSRVAVYILTPFNGEVQAFIENHGKKPRKAMLIWWFLERLDSTPILTDGTMDRLNELFDAIWISCRHMATMHKAFKHVVLASHVELGGDPHEPLEFDFTHQSYVWGRRQALYERLKALDLKEGPNAWGEQRAHVLRRSATMVHVQQFHGAFYTPLRFALSAAYALPLVSEKLADPFPLDFVDQAPFDQLPSLVQRVAANPADRGQQLFEALCVDRTFRSEVEKAL